MRLFIMRHGDAQTSFEKGDFYRKLSKTGKEQAKKTALFLSIIAPNISLDVLCSSALRTRETFHEVTEYLTLNSIDFKDEIYPAQMKDLFELLQQLPEEFENVLLIGHNPTVSNLVNYLVDAELNFPTAGLVEIVFPIVDKWKYIGASTGIIAHKNF